MSNIDWKDKFCDTCIFRVMEKCKRFPPITSDGFFPTVKFYDVRILTKIDSYFSEACSEYRES